MLDDLVPVGPGRLTHCARLLSEAVRRRGSSSSPCDAGPLRPRAADAHWRPRRSGLSLPRSCLAAVRVWI